MKTFNIWPLALGVLCALYGGAVGASDLGSILGGGSDHFKKALPGQPIRLPADHSAHPDYRSEWWYITGNLKDEQGRDYGMQWTLFRQGIEQEITSENPWLTPQLWLAQFAITDLSKGSHQQDERTSRQGPGLAGASGGQYWLKEWVLASQEESLFPATLKVQSKAGDLDVKVSAAKPAVLQGKQGYSEKSPGNASFYYSYPRLTITGTLTLDGETRNVSGEGWFDHEWSSSVLAEWQSGWDWFSLQFEDGRELMLFRLRTKAGRTEPENRYGILIERDGSSRVLNPEQIRLTPGKTWRGPKGQDYPIEWQLEADNMKLSIRAHQPDQAMTGRFDYWEGAVSISGDAKGVGYLEMTGY
ncbi:lipocalin-like domain-containing protein [Aeromonas enteropelogenes]|uniref:lipocalin-like domain-containing protein n=1 Tax=Aeromonas enteropelogenes TaxID=29489 RepID=UPI003F742280